TDQRVTPETFGFRLNWPRLREARRREGSYLLRTNLTASDAAQLWTLYLQLIEVEQAFQGAQRRLSDPPDLPSNGCADRSAHRCCIHCLLPADHAEAAIAVSGTRTDPSLGAGQNGGDANGYVHLPTHGGRNLQHFTHNQTR